jgi:acetyl esterase
MPVDPAIQGLLDQLAAGGGPPMAEQSLADARQVLEGLALLAVPVDFADITERSVPGPAGDIPVRVYVPEGVDNPPVLVWFHGGGWVTGSLDSTDAVARSLATEAGMVVVSVGYRLAPEAPAPAAVDDALAVVAWVRDNGGTINADATRLAVGGDSAGGNIAAVVALRTKVEFQLLVYPVTDATMSSASMKENAEGYLLTESTMQWFVNHYLAGSGIDATDPGVSPLFADDVSGVAPALVLTAEFDPLRDEGEAYAAKLVEAGVPCELVRYDGMTHAFFQLTAITPIALAAQRVAAARMKAALT